MNVRGSCRSTGNAGAACLSVRFPPRPFRSDGSTTVLHAELQRGTPVVLLNRRESPVAHACEQCARTARSTRRDVLVPEQQPAERHQRRSYPPVQRHNNACSRPPCRGDFSSPVYTQAVPPGSVALGRSAADADRWAATVSVRIASKPVRSP
jgi:hypothetical protein